MAEAMAIQVGLKWCIDYGYKEVEVESDSLVLINAINKHIGTPWQIAHLVEQIRELRQEGNFKFSYCYREANCTADLLANWSIYKTSTFFTEADTLPLKVRATLKNDRDQLVNFRIRTRKKFYDV
ncbi:uncharacterized protein LOC142180078 [Nicotiana tabacum]|uniref:Uncharacterized protein LOC142180078 n=1 Tax=Nicotiana tabacum TaxID=4097 RepID=A0AC58UC81_TOBAC